MMLNTLPTHRQSSVQHLVGDKEVVEAAAHPLAVQYSMPVHIIPVVERRNILGIIPICIDWLICSSL